MKRPDVGLQVRITERHPAHGCIPEYALIIEGIVADEQPPSRDYVNLTPVAGGGVQTFLFVSDTVNPPLTKRTLEVIGWPVGMIALWSAYDANMLKDAFVDQPFRWDGEWWLPMPGKDTYSDDLGDWLQPHDGLRYPLPPDESSERSAIPKMGRVIWDGTR